jgi:integrin alpha FG-GAP repeat containing protein 1
VLENVPCKKGVAGCTGGGGGGKRGLRVGRGKGWEVLDEVWDVEGASWLDLDDDVSLPVGEGHGGKSDDSRDRWISWCSVQGSRQSRRSRSSRTTFTTTHSSSRHRVRLVFRAAIAPAVTYRLVLNGACDGDCQPVDGSKKYSVCLADEDVCVSADDQSRSVSAIPALHISSQS